jgi:hypothetical protein
MDGGTAELLRSPAARALMLGAFVISLVLGIGFVVINTSPETEIGALGHAAPLTDDESMAQVVEAAQQIVTVAQLHDVNGSLIFLSCTNLHDPPYQAAIYLNFPLPETNAVKRVREIATTWWRTVGSSRLRWGSTSA